MLGNLFTENLRLKLIAVILAIALEIYFISPHNYVTATLNVPLELTNIPPTMMVVWPPDAERGLRTVIKVKGPSPLIQQIRGTPFRISSALPSDVGATFGLVVDPSSLRLPSGVDVVEIEPQTIDLRLERVVKKELKVVFVPTGNPPPGMAVVSTKVFPESVVARGPESELKGLSTVETQKVDISGVTSAQLFEVPLREVGLRTTLSVNLASAEVKVGPVLARREISGVRVKVMAPSGFAATVVPSRVVVTVSGPEGMVNQLASDQLEAVADASNLGGGDYQLGLSVPLKAGLDLIKTEPAEVAVTVSSGTPKVAPKGKSKEG